MAKALDITGKVFGRLTVINLSEKRTCNKRHWNCACVCGGVVVVAQANLNRGATKSCGCFHKDRAIQANKTHGMTGLGGSKQDKKLFGVWMSMRWRCNSPKDEHYKNYGGRGIKVCPEWGDFAASYTWALANGYENGLQIDRSNNDKGYSPENCRWVSSSTNCRNTRQNRVFTVLGVTKCLTELAEDYGQPARRVFHRLRLGWTIEDALFTPKYNLRGSK